VKDLGSSAGTFVNGVAATAARELRPGDVLTFAGGQYGTVVTSQDARRAVHDLRHALAGAALDDATAAEARARVAEIEQKCTHPSQTRNGRPARSNGSSSCSPRPDRWLPQAQP